MLQVIQKPLLAGLILKCCAIVCGYALWDMMNKPYPIKTTLNIPVSFYNNTNFKIEAPETIQIKILGNRKGIFKTAHTAAVHCDVANLQEGKNSMQLSDEQIFLPEAISLLDYTPKIITVTITPEQKTL